MLLSLPVAAFYDFFLIFEDKQLWRWDREKSYTASSYLWLEGVEFIVKVMLLQSGRKALWELIWYCSLDCLYFFFSEVKTRLLLVLLQYTGLSSSLPAAIRYCRTQRSIKVKRCARNKRIKPLKDVASCRGESICELSANNIEERKIRDRHSNREFYKHERKLKEPYQCYFLPFVIIGHIGYRNLAHFSQNIFISEILCLFTFCPYSINVTESTWKCVTMLVKRASVSKSFFTLIFKLGKQHL